MTQRSRTGSYQLPSIEREKKFYFYRRLCLIFIALMALTVDTFAQEASQNTGVKRRDAAPDRQQSGSNVSARAKSFYGTDGSASDADVQWMKVIYRQIDLNDAKNAALYFPEEPIEGQENLFRIIMRLLCDNEISAYEYLDGREIFTDKYKVKLGDVLDRFHIYYTTGKGGSEKNPKYEIDENDVPTNEVLSYYIIERWEYDTRTNALKSVIEAICPVLHRAGDFGGDAVKYPMFWVKYGDLRPYLAQQSIFVSDDNNLPTCNYDDFFNLAMYNGEIYKTRNLRNQSLMQIYTEPDELKHAQDSIQAYLDNFEKKLWVPDREEIIAAKEAAEAAAAEVQPSLDDVVAAPAGDDSAVAAKPAKEDKSVRSTKRGTKQSKEKKEKKVSKPKTSKPKSSGGAARSVRRKK